MLLKKVSLILAFSLLWGTVFAGEFKKVSPHTYEYTDGKTGVDFTDLAKLIEIIAEEGGETVTIIIDSSGGYLDAGYDLGNYTRGMGDNIKIIVRKAVSAAGLWAIGDKDFTYEDADSFVHYHLPYIPSRRFDEGDALNTGWEMGKYLEQMLTEADAFALMDKMAWLRDTHGRNTFVQWDESGVESFKQLVWEAEVDEEGEATGEWLLSHFDIEIPEKFKPKDNDSIIMYPSASDIVACFPKG